MDSVKESRNTVGRTVSNKTIVNIYPKTSSLIIMKWGNKVYKKKCTPFSGVGLDTTDPLEEVCTCLPFYPSYTHSCLPANRQAIKDLFTRNGESRYL